MTVALAGALLIAGLCFALCVRTGAPELISPRYPIHNLGLWAKLGFARVFKLPLYTQRQTLIASSAYYFETVARARNLAVTVLCGGGIALCGVIFQTIFKNPAASPTMLGVSNGIELGMLILVLKYSADVFSKTTERYLLCFGMALAMLALVMFLGKLVGGNRRSVTDMLLSGSILSQISGVVMMYFRFNMAQEDLQTLQTLTLYGFTVNTTYSFAGVSLVILVMLLFLCVMPFILMRFSFDAMSFADEETALLGINPGVVRALALFAVTFIMTAAILYCGSVGILSLVIPHACRAVFGARFKTMLAGSALLGALLLVICRVISSLIYIDGIGFLPIGPIVGLVSAPLLVAVLVKRRSAGYET
ncbi:MAG: iron ABC transporter permease [Oscillospiraceae bacterium]|nr:iron ABC transporter permease [Oscillospiraceae bacterium]